MKECNSRSNAFWPSDIRQTLILFLGIVLFVSVLVKGMYFDAHFWYVELVIALAFLLFLFKGTGYYLNSLIDYGVLLLTVAYIIVTSNNPLNLGDSIATTARLISYLLFFLLVSSVIKNLIDVHRLLLFIYLAGTVTAGVGLAVFYGIWELEGAVYGGTRLASFFQYPNTTAIYLLISFLVGIYFARIFKGKIVRLVFITLNNMLFLAFWATQSRAATLVLPVVIFSYLALEEKVERGYSSFAFFNCLVPGIILSNWTLSISPNYAVNIFKLLALMAVAVGVNLLGLKIKSQPFFGKVITKKVLFFLFITFFAGVIFVGLIVYGYFEESNFNRIFNISLQERSLVERTYFYKDGIEIAKDYILFGTGGGGWQALYQKYQSYGYHTAVPHNFFLQTLIETGVLGISALIMLYIGVIRVLYKLWRYFKNDKRKLLPVITSVFVALTLHSALDFNMSFGSVALVFWLIIGVIRYFQMGIKTEVGNGSSLITYTNKYLKYIVMAFSIIVLINSIFSIVAINFASKAVALKNQNELVTAKTEFQEASKYYPFKGTFKAEIAQLDYTIGVLTKEKKFFSSGISEIKRALLLERANPTYYFIQGKLFLAQGDIEKGIASLESSAKLAPFNRDIYEELGYTYLMLGKYHLNKGEVDKGREYLNKVQEVGEIVRTKIAGMDEKVSKIQSPLYRLEITENLAQHIKEAEYINKNYSD